MAIRAAILLQLKSCFISTNYTATLMERDAIMF